MMLYSQGMFYLDDKSKTHFCSLQIIGDLPTFEINLDNNKLSCLLCIILSLKLPPPSLKNTTTYYNELPVSEYHTILCHLCLASTNT